MRDARDRNKELHLEILRLANGYAVRPRLVDGGFYAWDEMYVFHSLEQVREHLEQYFEGR
jgi:hypothetical protein